MKKSELNNIVPKYTVNWDYNGWRKASSAASPYTQKDWNQTLITLINTISIKFRRETEIIPNCLVVSCEMSAVFDDLEYFHISDESSKISLYEKIGVLGVKYKVYVDPYLVANTFYLLTTDQLLNSKIDNETIAIKFNVDGFKLFDEYNLNIKLVDKTQELTKSEVKEQNFHIPLSPISHLSTHKKNEGGKELNYLIAFYIYVGNIDDADVEQYIYQVADKLSLTKEYIGVQCLFIPTRVDYGIDSVIRII